MSDDDAADRDALARIRDHGVDLATPQDVEFAAWAPDRNVAHQAVLAVESAGYKADVFTSENGDRPSVYITKRMVMTFDSLTAEKDKIDQILGDYSMFCDGWGLRIPPKRH
jgi:hypothetical protein